MPKVYSSRHIISILKRNGFVKIDQTGSHKKIRYDERTVIVPAPRREIPYGTFTSIFRQSGLSKVDFE